ncbi:MAG: TSUP family transporter [Sporomusaceae bacterium]|nr:TSUP family transporter [Sporomusaceae bacterium]
MESIADETILFLLAAGFIAAFIDSTVGGGGLISLPALLLLLPPHLALGTNKLSATMGALTSSYSFFRSGKVTMELIKWLFWLCLAGSVAGALVVKSIPSQFLRPLVITMLIIVAVYTVLKKDWGGASRFAGVTRRVAVTGALAAAVLGFYDGFFGPGMGSFLIFVFLFLGFDFVEASGNAKALNLASNIGSLATFLLMDAVVFHYGLIMGVGGLLGAAVGSQVAIRKGTQFVRPLFLTVTSVMIGKQLWDLWK